MENLFVWLIVIAAFIMTIWLTIADRQRRAKMTPEERRAEDEEDNWL